MDFGYGKEKKKEMTRDQTLKMVVRFTEGIPTIRTQIADLVNISQQSCH